MKPTVRCVMEILHRDFVKAIEQQYSDIHNKAIRYESEIISYLKENNVNYILSGGFVSFLVGMTNTYNDIDVFITRNEEIKKGTVECLSMYYNRKMKYIVYTSLQFGKLQFIRMNTTSINMLIYSLCHDFDIGVCKCMYQPQTDKLFVFSYPSPKHQISPHRYKKYSARRTGYNVIPSLQAIALFKIMQHEKFRTDVCNTLEMMKNEKKSNISVVKAVHRIYFSQL